MKETTNTVENVTYCDCCGAEINGDVVTFDGENLCEDCLSERTVICSHCGERIWNDDNAGSSDVPLCERCYDHYYTRTLRIDFGRINLSLGGFIFCLCILHYEKFPDGTVKCIEDEIPFELPVGWEWCRLVSICIKLVDGDHNPPKGVDIKTEYLMLSSTNLNQDTIVEFDKVRYLSKSTYEKENGV